MIRSCILHILTKYSYEYYEYIKYELIVDYKVVTCYIWLRFFIEIISEEFSNVIHNLITHSCVWHENIIDLNS